MASRAQLAAEKIQPALDRGAVVLIDRFYSSTVAYQGAAGGVDADEIMSMARMALGELQVDLFVVIDLAAETGLDRVGESADRIEAKGLEFHRRVREGFLEFARSRQNAVVVDGARSVQEVQEDIWKAVSDAL